MSRKAKSVPESEEIASSTPNSSLSQKDQDMSDQSKDEHETSANIDSAKNDADVDDIQQEESAPSVSFTIVFDDDDEEEAAQVDDTSADHSSDSTSATIVENNEAKLSDEHSPTESEDNHVADAALDKKPLPVASDTSSDAISTKANQPAKPQQPAESEHLSDTKDPLMHVSSRINAEIHRKSKLKIDQYPILSLQNASYFPKKNRYAVLDNVNWPFYASSIQTVLVDSEDARMATMGLLSGLLLPTAGTVEFHGKNLLELEASEYRGHLVGIMFQQCSTRDELSALDNLILTMQASGRNFLKPMPVIAKEQLRRVNFPEDQIDIPVAKIQLIDRRRAEIARTLCCDATVIILDEPTAGLEHQEAITIMKLLEGLTQENKRCVIVVTSDDDIAQYGEMIYEV
ncbi:MAG: ATP-binding cassette domain-containing protein [Bifidobacterium sp.]|jgi:ABC-type lipoprotein export system ATPase subunit|nr:ATP-binding cassette domain-containing protein [Bifidobacterium sp.]MCH4175363.1 ATP-binding cassette domain-containing protein [Bifidobacterium sp.]